jgi:metal-dependent amidase/aminoacylase/carboxypeptidase family protein
MLPPPAAWRGKAGRSRERATMETIVDEMVRVRRMLHERPELSLVEFETAAYVADALGSLGLDAVRTGIGRTGVLGTLAGGKPGPVTLLRADMDALPVRPMPVRTASSPSEPSASAT